DSSVTNIPVLRKARASLPPSDLTDCISVRESWRSARSRERQWSLSSTSLRFAVERQQFYAPDAGLLRARRIEVRQKDGSATTRRCSPPSLRSRALTATHDALRSTCPSGPSDRRHTPIQSGARRRPAFSYPWSLLSPCRSADNSPRHRRAKPDNPCDA